MSIQRGKTVQVYTTDLSALLTIESSCVVQWPPMDAGVPRAILCRGYGQKSGCVRGAACKFVHANLSAKRSVLEVQDIHVNFAWRNVKDVTYDRLPAGTVLTVSEPNSRGSAESTHPSHLVLKTRGGDKLLAGQKRDAPSHCAHYRFNRVCNRGADCHFIHAVYIDPTAKPGQKAPAPVEHSGMRVSTHQSAKAAASTKQPPQERQAAPEPMPTPSRQHPLVEESSIESVLASGERTPYAAGSLPLSPCSSAASSVNAADTPVSMFRYDPYSWTSKLQMV